MYKRLPEPGYTRVKTILEIFPISRSRWYAAVKDGHIQKPIKISQRAAVWPNNYLNELLTKLEAGHRLF